VLPPQNNDTDDVMPTLEFAFHSATPKKGTSSAVLDNEMPDLDATVPYYIEPTKLKEEESSIDMTLPYEETRTTKTSAVINSVEPTVPYDMEDNTELQPTVPMEFTPQKQTHRASDIDPTVPFSFDTSPIKQAKQHHTSSSKALFSDSSSDNEEDSMYKIE
jgi:hypothetical protein